MTLSFNLILLVKHLQRVRRCFITARETSLLLLNCPQEHVVLINNEQKVVSAHLESEGLIKDGVERFLVNLGVELLLLVREDEDLHVRVRGAAAVHGEEISSLQDSHGQLRREEVCD